MVKTDNTTAYAGLFGCVGGGGEVKNVNIADSYIYASIKESNPSGNNEFAAAGSVCGKNNGGTIENCTNSGTVVVEDGSKNKNACYAGGVCGLNTHTTKYKGKISGCANSGRVSGYGYVGGVCGSTGHLTVNCGNTGSVSGSGNVGGATWYAVAQQWAVDNGVSDGADAMGALTREQLVTMLWRLNGEPVVNYLITTPDANQISGWALEAMRWAASTGLIEGDETGALNPTATCTRAQAATFMVRYLTPVTA